MKIGLLSAGLGVGARAETLRVLAQKCDSLGFGTLWAPEHVVLFDRYTESRYPYSADGAFAAPSTTDWMDPFVALSYAAAASRNIRLATGICLVPEHNPLILAKVIASLDVLSGGRFALGVGIGWSSEEFGALGIPFERRAQRTREYVDVMRKLWREQQSSHQGEFVSFQEVRSFPKPVQGGDIPIIFGGESGPALRRVAEYGTGWFGFNLSPEAAAAKIKRLSELLAERGRNLSTVDLIVSPYQREVTQDDLARYRDAGVNELVLVTQLPAAQAGLEARLEQIARDCVVPAARLS